MIAPEDGTEAYGLVCYQLGYDAMGVPASEDDDRKFEEYRWCGDLGSLEGTILDRCEKLNMPNFFDGMLSVFWAESQSNQELKRESLTCWGSAPERNSYQVRLGADAAVQAKTCTT